MKKMTLGLLVLAVATGANAKGNFEGWFVGADVHSTEFSVTEITGFHGLSLKAQGSKKAGVGIGGGFGWSWGSSNLMTQIEAKQRTGGATINAGRYELLKDKLSFSLSWLQGYRVADNFLPYIKIGVAGHRLKGDGVIFNNDGGVFGVIYGAGLKYAITENIEAGVEFTQTPLRDIDNKVKLKANTFSVGGSYRF